MKITLHSPPDGYKAEAEIRHPRKVEPFLNGNLQIQFADFDFKGNGVFPVLALKRQRAQVRRYWATVMGQRLQFVQWSGYSDFECGKVSYSENELTDITPIDPEYLDSPPVPEKDWWTGAENPREGTNDVLVWNGVSWLRRHARDILPNDIWRYQPPAPSVTRTDVVESEGV